MTTSSLHIHDHVATITLQRPAQAIRRAAPSDDLREGAAAWAQKRTPKFIGD